MEHTLRNCITKCLLEDYLAAGDATHEEDKGDGANKQYIYYNYGVGGFWKINCGSGGGGGCH